VVQVKNQRLSDEEFFKEREQVLAIWPTGKGIDLDEAVAYHKSMPASRVCAAKLEESKRTGVPLNFTHNGVPVLEWQTDLIKRLQDEGHAGLLTTHQDSMTRNQFFNKAAEAVQESVKVGKTLLNGFPIPIHGVAKCRKLIESVETPLLITGTSCDWRLTNEVGLAGGHTACTGDPFFCYFVYNKNTPLEVSIRNWQYIYRLRGYYEERGSPIVSRPDGTQNHLCPASVEDATRIISYLLAAEQGCKHICTNYLSRCNLNQDLAYSITLPKLAREYLDKFGYKDVVIYKGIQSFQGRHPYNRYEALIPIMFGPLAATLAKIQICGLFTIDEAHELPTTDAHLATLRFANVLVSMLKDQKFNIESEEVKLEARMNELEVRAIVDKVLEMGDGDIAVGTIEAVKAGVIDTPFSTARVVARKVMGVRDANGACRYLDTGNLPFSQEIKDFHKQKIAERSKKQNSEIGYDTIVQDLLSISEGYLVK
jgi:methylaspartate mutase epsilon subunit